MSGTSLGKPVGFSSKNPETNEEKLIVELVNLLHDTTDTFVNMNFNSEKMNHEQFTILFSSILGYASQAIKNLGETIVDEAHVISFLNDARFIFNSYMDKYLSQLKDNKRDLND